jgi:phospholipid N-methyltransferase
MPIIGGDTSTGIYMKQNCTENRGLAKYFEAHWIDYAVRESESTSVMSATGVSRGCSHAKTVAGEISAQISKHNIAPISLLEVGPALGRTSFELLHSVNTLKDVSFVEQSNNLFHHLQQIFTGKVVEFPLIEDSKSLYYASLSLESVFSKDKLNDIEFDFINAEFDSSLLEKSYDLVICLNVLDQCPSPIKLLNALKSKVKIGGVLCVSSTYQYPSKILADGELELHNLTDYFDGDWEQLRETNLDYKIRINHRCSNLFDSHLVIYKHLA